MIIKKLELYTSQLEQQTDFYSNIFQLEITDKNNDSVTFKIGDSILTFTYKAESKPYHFAFNIPANQEQEALFWLKERVDILEDKNQEIHHFKDWNAGAIYFYDYDNNIVEFIARKNLNNNSTKNFTAESLLEISEMGIPTFDIENEYNILAKTVELPIHSGNFERFCSLGDDEGLFILINKDLKKYWYPTNDTPYSVDFKIKFIEKDKAYNFQYLDEKLSLIE